MAPIYSMIDDLQVIYDQENENFETSINMEKKKRLDMDFGSDNCANQDQTVIVGGLSRTKTLHSFRASSLSSTSSTSSSSASGPLEESQRSIGENFASFDVPVFDKGTRRIMEPQLRKARMARENARSQKETREHTSIASHVGVPYVELRSERPFLFDVETHPMHSALTEALGVQDLSKLHEEGDLKKLMRPLRSRSGRRRFHESYDTFVTSFCIPLVHSIAMSKNIFHSTSPESRISYRYQAFPNIRVVKPGDVPSVPTCDTATGHSIGSLHFHVPLTPSVGTNALYTESYPGREDWHPLIAKSVGLGFLLDGARCLYFNMENKTNATSISLDFVVTLYGEEVKKDFVDGHCLCNKSKLNDHFSAVDGYYEEAVIDMNHRNPMFQIVAKKNRNQELLDPDFRVGFPFV